MIGKGEGSQVAGHGRVLTGDRHMVAAGHYAAAHAGFLVLEAGGNAIDAGVAAGIALGVLQSDIVNVAGVAPIMIRLAESGEVVTIDGLGVWPAAASAAFFRREHGGRIPDGLLRTVTPAAPAAWIAALERFGTMSFGEVARFAIRFAAEGFPVHPTMAEFVAKNVAQYAQFPQNAALYLPGGRPVAVGDRFVQPELAATLQHMVDEEKAHAGQGRSAGLAAARAAFYEGDIAQTIAAYHREHGGWLTADDLAGYEVTFEPPVRTTYCGVEVFTCGPWCTGPLLGQILAILDGIDIGPMGHNSPRYIHVLTEAMKLAFADREACYGDPRFVDVPLERLLSAAFAAERRRRIDPIRAAPRMPESGIPSLGAEAAETLRRPEREPALSPDTSYVAVIDRHGNAFSATPSDTSYDTPIIPGTGLCPSSRGSQSFTARGHPSEVMPGKRPRLTPNPAIAILEDGSVMPFGTPGGDVQTQAMLQVLLNLSVFGMDLTSAVEAPRFATYSFPSSFEPHEELPGRLMVEARIGDATLKALEGLGHDAQPWPEWTNQAGAVCAVMRDPATGVIRAAADPRRSTYAVGW
ncbi:MAG: gamma-glutamyltransferase family protein [Microvirga sp.]